MATTADFKNGMCIELNKDLLTVVEFQQVKSARSAAFYRVKFKSLLTGKTFEQTFNSGAKINPVRIERRSYQYLYKDDLGYHFMHSENFEQISLEEIKINAPQFLKDGQIVEITVKADDEMPLGCELPAFVELEITYTEPGIKGDTVNNTLKKATVETGAEVKVPLFINQGEKIKVDTRTATYSERVKN